MRFILRHAMCYVYFDAIDHGVNANEKFNIYHDRTGIEISNHPYAKILMRDSHGKVIRFSNPVISIYNSSTYCNFCEIEKLEVCLCIGNVFTEEIKQNISKLKSILKRICGVKPMRGVGGFDRYMYSYVKQWNINDYKRIINEIETIRLK